MFTLPSGVISISGTIFLLIFTISSFYEYIFHKIIKAQAIGFSSLFGNNFSFDPFYINTKAFLFISIILYLLGKNPKFVTASGASHINPNIEDVGFITMEFDNNLIAYIHTSWLDPNKIRKMTKE